MPQPEAVSRHPLQEPNQASQVQPGGIGEQYTIKSTIDAVKYSNTIQLYPFKCNHVYCYIVDKMT
jgi:hypothetical protein